MTQILLPPGQVGVTVRNKDAKEAARPPRSVIYRENVAYHRLRRTFDFVLALMVVTAASPLLLAACIAILIEDGWPVLFFQRRVGRFGKLFTIYKLRTMRKETCGDAFSPTNGRDPRITAIGYWLRKTSIDELPQLFNILKGDMAFVGPRPEMPFVVRRYELWQNLRHLAVPGVTGHWQTTCRKTVPLHLPEATLMDLHYISQASHRTDAMIMLKTVRQLISTEGAY